MAYVKAFCEQMDRQMDKLSDRQTGQKLYSLDLSMRGIKIQSLHIVDNNLTFYSIVLILMHQQPTAFENIVGKEEIARNEQFLLFPQCFLSNQIIVPPFVHIFDIISLCIVELEESKFGI